MYFKLKRGSKTLAISDEVLSLSIEYTLNQVANAQITIPISFLEHVMYKNEIEISLEDGSVFHGIFIGKSVSYEDATISVSYLQTLHEWSYQCIPINVVKKDTRISLLMLEKNIIYNMQEWHIKVTDDAQIEYEFSREDKLTGLNTIVGLTANRSYRVGRVTNRTLEIGLFGNKKNYAISRLNMLDGLDMTDSTSDLTNLLVVLSDKGDGGATSVTLRDVYKNENYQYTNFPVIITGNKINTQATQTNYNYTQFAPNNVHEFAIMDKTSIIRENGDIYEGTLSDNTIQPLQKDGKQVKNPDRIKASRMLYYKGVRKLLRSRRNLTYTTTVPDLPLSVNVGDKIRLVFEQEVLSISEFYGLNTTENGIDDWFYVASITTTVDEGGILMYELTLSYDLGRFLSTMGV